MLSLVLSGFLMSAGGVAGQHAANAVWEKFVKDHPEEAKAASETLVELLQAVLCVLGRQCPVTGVPDEATAEALKAYQLRRELDADAVYGRNTRRAVIADLLKIADEREMPSGDPKGKTDTGL
jgi:peptidoglycan hydrolase-like protein with peptidoglycan-binding domain